MQKSSSKKKCYWSSACKDHSELGTPHWEPPHWEPGHRELPHREQPYLEAASWPVQGWVDTLWCFRTTGNCLTRKNKKQKTGHTNAMSPHRRQQWMKVESQEVSNYMIASIGHSRKDKPQEQKAGGRTTALRHGGLFFLWDGVSGIPGWPWFAM